MSLFVLQMAGWMGSGKSTIARAVGSATGVVVVDHDTTKSAVMSSGVPHPPAGAVSYEVIFSLAQDFLSQGQSVIVDSPAAYESVPSRGMALAAASGANYYFVECDCPADVAAERVEQRVRRASQVTNAEHAAHVRADPSRVPHRPSQGVLVLDTTRVLRDCVTDVLTYLGSSGASGPVVGGRS